MFVVLLADADELMGDDWALLLYSPTDEFKTAYLVSQRKKAGEGSEAAAKGKGRRKGKWMGKRKGEYRDALEQHKRLKGRTPQKGKSCREIPEYEFFVLAEDLTHCKWEDYSDWIVVGTLFNYAICHLFTHLVMPTSFCIGMRNDLKFNCRPYIVRNFVASHQCIYGYQFEEQAVSFIDHRVCNRCMTVMWLLYC
jgi:hypothetical protein